MKLSFSVALSERDINAYPFIIIRIVSRWMCMSVYTLNSSYILHLITHAGKNMEDI